MYVDGFCGFLLSTRFKFFNCPHRVGHLKKLISREGLAVHAIFNWCFYFSALDLLFSVFPSLKHVVMLDIPGEMDTIRHNA